MDMSVDSIMISTTADKLPRRAKGWTFGTAIKMMLGIPTFHITVSGFMSQTLTVDSSFLLMNTGEVAEDASGPGSWLQLDPGPATAGLGERTTK